MKEIVSFSFNSDIVECKDSSVDSSADENGGFNSDIVECKDT